MSAELLEELGLTPAESKVYGALLEEDAVQAGVIVRATGLHNSIVHLALGSLLKKGLISFHREGRARIFSAADPRTLLEQLEDRKQRLKQYLAEIRFRRREQRKNEAEAFYRFGGFRAAHYRMIEGVRPGTDWLFFAFYSKDPSVMEQVHAFYAEFEQERAARGITVKGVAPKNWAGYYRGRRLENICLVDFPILYNINICADRVMLTPWDDGEVCFLITSDDVASHFRRHFKTIWRKR